MNDIENVLNHVEQKQKGKRQIESLLQNRGDPNLPPPIRQRGLKASTIPKENLNKASTFNILQQATSANITRANTIPQTILNSEAVTKRNNKLIEKSLKNSAALNLQKVIRGHISRKNTKNEYLSKNLLSNIADVNISNKDVLEKSTKLNI